jgi:hypothetical protein
MSETLSVEKEQAVGAVSGLRAFRLGRPRLETVVAMALIVGVVLWRAWAGYQWTFQGDDWHYVSFVERIPLLKLMGTPDNGHLMAGQFALVWVVTKIAPLNYAVAVSTLLIATFLAGILMWRFLIALFGHRAANLIPLAIFMLCPLSVPPILWWAAGLNIFPLQLFIVATLFAVLRYVRSPARGRLVAAGLAYAGGLLFWEKGLLILPLAFAFAVLFLGEGTGRARLRDVLFGRWHLWAVLGGLSAAYAAWYFAVSTGQHTTLPTLAQLWDLAATATGTTILTTALGGPWRVSPHGLAILYQVHGLAQLTVWAFCGAVVVGSMVRHRQAWRAWVLPALSVGLSVVLLAATRLNYFSPRVLALAPRYFAESVPVVALAVALAFMVPLDRVGDPGWERGLLPRRDGAVDLPPNRVRSPATWRAVAIGFVVVYAVSAMVTGSRMAGLAEQFSEKNWFASVRSELAAHPNASIFDGTIPRHAGGVFPPHLSLALEPIARAVRWNGPDAKMLMFDDGGRLRLVRVVGGVTGQIPTGSCNLPLQSGPITVPLDGRLPRGTWGVWIGYFASGTEDGVVTIDSETQPVELHKGLHSVILIHAGTASSVTIDPLDGRFCIGAIRVGTVAPGASE